MAMNPYGTERRETKRILFSREDDITAQAYLPKKPKKPVLSFLLNISESGLALMINRAKMKKLRVGDVVTLRMIMTPKPLDPIDVAEVEVKNILSDHSLEYATINCEFVNISDFHMKKIRQFVHYLLNEIGSNIYKKSFSLKY